MKISNSDIGKRNSPYEYCNLNFSVQLIVKGDIRCVKLYCP
jgi:hypothetical protein